MARICVWVLVAIVTVVIDGKQVESATISPQNPYRSFNISGVNYGSMRWERSQRRPTYSQRRPSGIVFRRR